MTRDSRGEGQVAHPDALADAVAATRSLSEALRVADAPREAIERATSLVSEAHDLLAAHRVDAIRAQSTLRFEARTNAEFSFDHLNDLFPYSPVIGRLNAIAPPVELRLDGERVRGRVTLPAPYTGPPGSVHGGIIALVFDELLGGVCVWNGVGAFTGTLSIRYERFTPVETEIELEAWIDRSEGRKIFVVGEMTHNGAVTARAEGIFIRAQF